MNGSMTTRQIVEYYRKHNPKVEAVKHLAEQNGVHEEVIEDILEKNGIDLRYYKKMKKTDKEVLPVAESEQDDLNWVIPKSNKTVNTEKAVIDKPIYEAKVMTAQDVKARAYESVLKMLDAKVVNECINFYCAAITDVIAWMEEFYDGI